MRTNTAAEVRAYFENLTDEQYNLFVPLPFTGCDLNNYTLVHDVYLTRPGICLKNGLPLMRTVYKHYLVMPRLLRWAYGTLLKRGAVRLDDDKSYCLLQTPFCNYYHWLTESLPRLQPVWPLLDDITVLVPSHTPFTRVMAESLQALGVENFEIFPEDTNARCKKVVIPDSPPYQLCMSDKSVAFIRDRLKPVLATPRPPHRFVYISRENASYRKVVNESEVIDILRRFDFEIVIAEDLSFLQQVELMAETAVLISIAGAGLTNMLFMAPGSTVVEMRNRTIIRHRVSLINLSPKLNPCFARLAMSCRLDYHAIFCDAADMRQSRAYADIYVALPELTALLEKISSRSNRTTLTAGA